MRNMILSHDGMEVKRIREGVYPMETHFHPQYELCFLLSGERFFFVRDLKYHLVKGDLLLIPSNELHRGMDAGRADYEKLEIKFYPSFIQSLHTVMPIRSLLSPFEQTPLLLHLHMKDQNYVEQLFYKMIAEIKHPRHGNTAVLRMMLAQLLILAARLQIDNTPSSVPEPAPLHPKAAELVEYVNTHYTESVTLASLAAKYHYHPCYLSLLFKQITGFTFSEYMNSMRVKASQQLLRETNKDITEISSEVGFSSLSHYGRVFKSIVGHSPSEYRRSQARG